MLKRSNLIYDVGMNNGDDTAYYLHKGYRVVAIEADPCLVETAHQRFQDEIREGRLTVVNVGISDRAGSADFWVNEVYSEWSSFDRNIASRDGLPHHAVQVPCVRFESILAEYGIPHYLKIDIEGNDVLCVNALTPENSPDYISVEMGGQELIDKLRGLGYTHFKCIDQFSLLPLTIPISMAYRAYQCSSRLLEDQSRPARMLKRFLGWGRMERFANHWRRVPGWSFSLGSSGRFGEDTPGRWQSYHEITVCWQHYYDRHTSDRTKKAYAFWCDLHAHVGR